MIPWREVVSSHATHFCICPSFYLLAPRSGAMLTMEVSGCWNLGWTSLEHLVCSHMHVSFSLLLASCLLARQSLSSAQLFI